MGGMILGKGKGKDKGCVTDAREWYYCSSRKTVSKIRDWAVRKSLSHQRIYVAFVMGIP